MSLYNINNANNLEIRSEGCYSDAYYIRNKLTNKYERLQTGGGGSGELPDYLYSSHIQFQGSEGVLNGPRLDAIKQTEEEENNIKELVLPAHEASLEELDQRVAGQGVRLTGVETKATNNATAITDHGTRLTAVETKATNNATAITGHGTRLTAVETKATNNASAITGHGTRLTAHEASIEQVDSKVISVQTDITNNVKPKLVTNPLTLGTGNNTITLDSVTDPKMIIKKGTTDMITVKPSLIEMKSITGTENLTYNSLEALNKLRYAGGISDPTGYSVIVKPSTAGDVNYKSIPASVFMGGSTTSKGYYKLETQPEDKRTFFSINLHPSVSGLWIPTESSISRIDRFNFFHELTLDFGTTYFSAGNANTTRNFGFVMNDVNPSTDAVFCRYYPASDDTAVPDVSAFIDKLAFTNTNPSLIKNIIRFRVQYNNVNATNFKGKIQFFITKNSTNTDAKPTDFIIKVS